MLELRILGTPAGQGSAKAYVVAGRARVTNTNAKHRSWRTDVVEQTQTQLPEGWKPITGPCAVTASFFQRPPKSLTKAQRALPPDRGIDIDKLARALLDALNVAGIYDDDKRVVQLSAAKLWADDNNPEGAVIRLMGLVDREHTGPVSW